jgi:hypothetical protein
MDIGREINEWVEKNGLVLFWLYFGSTTCSILARFVPSPKV